MSQPSDHRYAAVLASLISPIDLDSPGIGIVIAPSGEQALIAEALAPNLGGIVLPLLDAATRTEVPCAIVPGLPPDADAAEKQLGELNGRRDFTALSGRHIVVVLSPFEIVPFQRYAGDVYSSIRFVKVVRFIPDPAVDEAEARASLARHYRERFGRLDLRGFVRSEAEDVSFSIEDVYEAVQASYSSRARLHTEPIERTIDRTIPEWLAILPRDLPIVVLGHPGSGKTFLLRWLALAAARSELGATLNIAAPLPLIASLPAYEQAPQPMDLVEYFTETLLIAGQPAAHILGKAIAAREAIFLLDGLDEVGAWPALALEAIRKLREQAPGCLILVTCRIAGYGPDVPDAHHLTLSPFGDDAVKRFLARWCELYAVTRLGESDAVRQQGRREGEQLAGDVLSSEGVRALARNPLLLTVLAIVHRAGVRLPDHRVELYAQATRVLVERWNRVRSLSGEGTATPIRTADAVRLLGPLALEKLSRGGSIVFEERALRGQIARALKEGTLRGVGSADEVIALFRNELGLLVEQARGIYAFLHLTLAEYFAAWELIRTDALEDLASDPKRAFEAQYREVILLAAGELGVVRAEDWRLNRLVARLCDSAGQAKEGPSPTVPSLLAGLLADDPHLTAGAAGKIADELIPKWWFKSFYGKPAKLQAVIREAGNLAHQRIARGRFGPLVRTAVEHAYGSGFSKDDLLRLARGGTFVLSIFLSFLRVTGIDYGPHVRACLSAGKIGRLAIKLFGFFVTITAQDGSDVRGTFRVSRQLDDLARSGTIELQLKVSLFGSTGSSVVLLEPEQDVIPWSSTSPTGEQTCSEVTLGLQIRVTGGHQVTSGNVTLLPPHR